MEFKIELFMHSILIVHEHKKMISLIHRKNIYKQIKETFNLKGCKVHGIGGTENHVHIIHEMNPDISIDKFLKIIKLSTQHDIRTLLIPNFLWDNGYYTYSISKTDVENECLMLSNERNKHKTMTLNEELRKLRKELEMFEVNELSDISENQLN